MILGFREYIRSLYTLAGFKPSQEGERYVTRSMLCLLIFYFSLAFIKPESTPAVKPKAKVAALKADEVKAAPKD